MAKVSPSMAPALLLAAYQLTELEKTLDQLDIDESLDPVENALAGMFVALPIQATASKKPTKFLALVGGTWVPCYEGEPVEDKNDPLVGGLHWKAIAANGDEIRGYAKAREWAVPKEDGTPNWSCLTL